MSKEEHICQAVLQSQQNKPGKLQRNYNEREKSLGINV